MKFVNISLQSSLSLANERDEVSSFSKSLPHEETEKTVELEQSNQEVIIESIPTKKTLVAKDKIDSINDVATWPEVITYYMKVEMVKAGPERYQNKEGPFKPAIRVIKEGDKEKESLSFLSKKWFFYKTLKNGNEVLRSWLLYSNSHSGLYCFCCKLFQSKNDNSQFVSTPFVNSYHLNQWFLTFFFVFTLLTKVLTKFTLNILNNAHLLKNEISKLLQLYLFNVTAALAFWQRAFQCLVKL